MIHRSSQFVGSFAHLLVSNMLTRSKKMPASGQDRNGHLIDKEFLSDNIRFAEELRDFNGGILF